MIPLNEIEVAMMTYVDYVMRKMKEDGRYQPHPIVRAIALAINASENQADGRYSGISGDPEKEGLHMAVVEKQKGKYQILSLFDAKMGKELGFDVAVRILKISIQLDRYDSDEIQIDDAITILSDNFPLIKFKHLTSGEAREAIAYLKEQHKQGKLVLGDVIPESIIDQELDRDVEWKDRSQTFRSLVGGVWGSRIDPKGRTFVITTPDTTMAKHKIVDLAKMLMLGPLQRYMT